MTRNGVEPAALQFAPSSLESPPDAPSGVVEVCLIVECPRCSARYRVDDSVREKDPRFRCSRCTHIFSHSLDDADLDAVPIVGGDVPDGEQPEITDFDGTQEPKTPSTNPASRAAADAEDPGYDDSDTGSGESLSFSFGPDPETPADEEAEDEGETEPDSLEEGDELSFDEEEEPPAPPSRAPTGQRNDEPRFGHGEDELRVEPPAERSSARTWLVFSAVLVGTWANIALYLHGHGSEAISALAEIPVVGRPLTEDRALRRRVHLDQLRGVYHRIKDGQLVFIVSGRANNLSTGTLRGVQIESVLYDNAGESAATKSIYCGNAMSLKIVKNLSSKEISLLQRLEPPQRFEILTGQSAAFTVVFMNPPEEFREFSARVVAAERTTSS